MKRLPIRLSGRATAAEKKMVERMVRQCYRELHKKEYELPPPNWLDLHLKVKVCGRSYGGEGFMSISIRKLRDGQTRITEYAHIANDRCIGSIALDSPDRAVMCIVCHEFAHYVQHSYYQALNRYRRRNWNKPHGDGWQLVYGWLRRKFINPHRVESTP